MIALVRGEQPDGQIGVVVTSWTSTKTGARPFWTIGEPCSEARGMVILVSAWRRRSPTDDMGAVKASGCDDPELTNGRPTDRNRRRRHLDLSVKRPAVVEVEAGVDPVISSSPRPTYSAPGRGRVDGGRVCRCSAKAPPGRGSRSACPRHRRAWSSPVVWSCNAGPFPAQWRRPGRRPFMFDERAAAGLVVLAVPGCGPSTASVGPRPFIERSRALVLSSSAAGPHAAGLHWPGSSRRAPHSARKRSTTGRLIGPLLDRRSSGPS